jgi:CheY-like chemotaxis protein
MIDVLIGEIEPVSRRLLEKSLQHWGYRPLVCTDGVEALALLRSPESPRIAVLDWVMPEMDGVDICRAIRDGDAATRPT